MKKHIKISPIKEKIINKKAKLKPIDMTVYQ